LRLARHGERLLRLLALQEIDRPLQGLADLGRTVGAFAAWSCADAGGRKSTASTVNAQKKRSMGFFSG